MFIIGVTGGFLSGKTTVTKIFQELGEQTVSVDELYNQVLKDNLILKKKIISKFGEELIDVQGQISKQKIKKKLLENINNFQELNKITHPFIIARLKQKIKEFKQIKTKLLVIEVPLLYETKLEYIFNSIIVVFTYKYLQFQRAQLKGYDNSLVNLIIKSQLPLQFKTKQAKYIIRNVKERNHLRLQVLEVYKRIKNLSNV